MSRNINEQILFYGPEPLDSKNSPVSSKTKLISIPRNQRYVGMRIYVIDEKTDYILKEGTANSNWVKASSVELAMSATTTTESYAKSYALVDPSSGQIYGDKIDIPKDQFLSSATYDDSTHILSLNLITETGLSTTNINLSGLTDVYESGRYITISTDATTTHNMINFNLPIWSGTGEGALYANYSGNVASGRYSFVEGYRTSAVGDYTHAEGESTNASGESSHAEGYYTSAIGFSSHAEGQSTNASGDYSHAEGANTKAYGMASHAEGTNTSAVGESSHAEGALTSADGGDSHAEGQFTNAYGYTSHAEGQSTNASGESSHAEGTNTSAVGESSHAEGESTNASGDSSHAEGQSTSAVGDYSHAEGQYTNASGDYSHAEGGYTIANNQSEHASGQYNVSNSASTTFGDSGNTLFSVGNGTATTAPKNAFEIRQNGDIYIPYNGNNSVMLQLLLNQTIEHLTSTGTTLSLKPNRYYVFDVKISTLNLSLDSSYTETNLLYTYSVEFMPTGTMSVTLPSGVKWVNDTTPTFTELMKYRIEIKHGFADIVKVSE